jgi:hypothetical protein
MIRLSQYEVDKISRNNKQYEFFKKYSDEILVEIKALFDDSRINIPYTNIDNNNLSFQFWGNELIIRSELSLNTEHRFTQMELNTYCIHLKREKLLFSHCFDDNGFIGFDRSKYHSYQDLYISELLKKITEYSIDNNLKFQLK